MRTDPVPMGSFVRKEFILGKLKPEYALMNKVIHNMIGPKGKEKLPSKEEIQFLYEVMTRKIIDYALVILSRPASRSDPIGGSEPVSGCETICLGLFTFFFFRAELIHVGIQTIFVITKSHLHIQRNYHRSGIH